MPDVYRIWHIVSICAKQGASALAGTAIPSERLDRATLNSRTRAAGALSLGCLAVSACGGAPDRGAGQWGTSGARRANGFRPVQRARDREPGVPLPVRPA